MASNVYGVEAKLNADEFNDWEWDDYGKAGDIIRTICADAAKTVLDVIGERTQLGIYSGKKGCGIRVLLGDDIGKLSAPFGLLIEKWIDIHGGGEETHPLIAALEDALARIKAVA